MKKWKYRNLIYLERGRLTAHLGIDNVINGIGFLVSLDNPYVYDRFILIELKFIYINFWCRIKIDH